MIFFGLRQAVEDCPPILRVLDTKKQIVRTHRSRKHNLQHLYAPKFAIFHEKNGQQWPFFGQKFGFFEASSDPRGHLGVTWGVYLCAGKPPLADIILSRPPDLT